MLKLFLHWCECIFPERSEHKLVRQATIEDIRLHLRPTVHTEFISLLPFEEPLVRALIHEAKFQENEKAWRLLGEILSEYLKHCEKGTVLLPIPLSSKRRQERGYNQVSEIATRAVKSSSHVHLIEHVIRRVKDTKPQTSLDRGKRLKNVEGAFAIRSPEALLNKTVIILDDVVTTGATLKAARASLAPLSLPSITLLALAH